MPFHTRRLVLCLVIVSTIFGCSESDSARPGLPEKMPSTYDGPPVEFKPKYAPGEYRLTTRQQQKQTVRAAEAPQAQETELTIVQRATVSEADGEGNRTLKMTYVRIRQEQSAGERTLNYDSEGPEESNNPLLARIYSPMLGEELTATAGPNGAIKKVRGMNAIWDQIAAGLGPRAAGGIESLKKQMGNETIAQMMDMGRRLLPQKEVQPGDQWAATTRLYTPMLGQLTTTASCLLQDIEETPNGKIALIECAGRTSSEGGTSTVGKVRTDIHEINLTQKITMRFNLESGMIVRQHAEQSGPITMTLTGPQGKTGEATIDQELTMTTEWEKLSK